MFFHSRAFKLFVLVLGILVIGSLMIASSQPADIGGNIALREVVECAASCFVGE